MISKQRKKIVKSSRLILLGLATLFVVHQLNYWNIIPRKSYTAEDFDIEVVVSSIDFNQNGIDDYRNIMLGTRIDAENKPKYDGQYWAEGYPPDDMGVCTDVIWRALEYAGYNLKAMIDQDISENINLYPRTNGIQDSNIDFRRVPNLIVFFERHALSLTLDPTDFAAWQPGDIVTYGDNHIAIVSDKRNRRGIPYIIHNGGQPNREEDALTRSQISGHFRFDASLIDDRLIIGYN